MTLFFLSGLLLLLALFVVAYPLVYLPLERYEPDAPPDALMMERDNLLEGLQDLDMALGAGKLSEADYRWQKAMLERDYARVLAALDGPAAGPTGPMVAKGTMESAAHTAAASVSSKVSSKVSSTATNTPSPE